MAFFGANGAVGLYREWPEPGVLLSGDFSLVGTTWRLHNDENAWMSGDRVRLVSPRGVPFDVNADGYADCPMGHRMYGPEPVAGPTTLHRLDDSAPMYRDDAELFYEDETTTGLRTDVSAFIHLDALDRVSFYASEVDARNGGTTGLLPMAPVDFERMALLADWSETDGWRQVCSIQGFALDTDPENLDTAAIGEEFGSYVRGLVRGAGSFRGQMGDRFCRGTSSTTRMAKLALMTRKGATAKARFTLSPGDPVEDCEGEPPLFYEADILMGKTSVRLDVNDVVGLEAQFVVTGQLRMLTGYDQLQLEEPPDPELIALELPGLLLTEQTGFIPREAR